MASARADALDWALALARSPGERHALRQRSLPGGMDALLQIAAGAHGATLAEAATHTGRAPAELVDAARFYLREVLFFPDADAYRVLGLEDDASNEQIKHHHRLLQQWLHPDRPTSDWDAVFAARVNAAWSQLRTASRREAYARSRPALPAVAVDPSWAVPARLHAAPADAQAGAGRWRRRTPVLALFGVCAVLGVLAIRDLQSEPETHLADAEAATAATMDTPLVALQLPSPRPATPAAKPPRTDAAKPRARPVTLAAKVAKPAPKRVAQPRVAPVIVAAAVAPPAPRHAVAPAAKPVVADPMNARVVASATPPAIPVADAEVEAEAEAVANLPDQVAQAEQTGKRLLAFVAGKGGGIPPIWANHAAQTQASQARDALQGNGRIVVGQPDWRVGGSSAAMLASLTPRDGDARHLRVDLVWREQRWLVTSLALERAP